jgi:hypothetical protein
MWTWLTFETDRFDGVFNATIGLAWQHRDVAGRVPCDEEEPAGWVNSVVHTACAGGGRPVEQRQQTGPRVDGES